MPGAMPAELGEKLSDRPGPQPDASDLKQAREDLAEQIIAGKTVAGLDIARLFDLEIDERNSSELAEEFASVFGSVWKDHGLSPSYWLRCNEYLTKLAAKHLSEQAVLDRAMENMADD